MIYVAYQLAPVPGKAEALAAATIRGRKIAEKHGAKQIGGFQVTLGQGVGSMVYIVSYPDGDAYVAAGKELNDSGYMKEVEALTASSESAVLQPLPGSALQ